MSDNRPTYIYALCEDADVLTARYVGKTVNMAGRYKTHVSTRETNKRTHKANWLRKLLSNGTKPIMVELECVPAGGDWVEAERRWIAYFRNLGLDLTNATEGGEGVPGLVPSADTRRKLSEAGRGNKRAQGAERSPEFRASVSEALTGRPKSEEHRAKFRGNKNAVGNTNRLGKTHSEETRQKISESLRGRTTRSDYHHSEETKAKIRESQRHRRERERLESADHTA